jgi:hypothetical protein
MATLNVTTLDRIKSEGITDVTLNDHDKDQALDGLIAEVSTAIEQYIGRDLLVQTVTEVRDTHRFQESIWLYAPPVASITSVFHRSSFVTAWADASEIESTAYDFDATSGRLLMSAQLAESPQGLQIIYSGGFSLTTAALVTAYPEIVSAGERQIAHEWRRRTSLDQTAKGIGGGRSQPNQSVDISSLLPAITKTLDAYRLWRVF